MIPYALVTAYLVLLALTAANAHAADPSKGGVIDQYVRQAQACQKQLGQPRFPRRISPWDLRGHNPAKVLRLWQTRLAGCRETRRQWNWSAWLPDKWRRVGVCETGLNWNHANSSYVSAFGIQRGAYDGAYDHDAARVGMPPWNDEHPPTPWQQLQTALSHYAHHGGFSGWGCGGA